MKGERKKGLTRGGGRGGVAGTYQSDTPARSGGLLGTVECHPVLTVPWVPVPGLESALQEVTQPAHEKSHSSGPALSRHLPSVLFLGSAAFLVSSSSHFSPSLPPNCISLSAHDPLSSSRSKRVSGVQIALE